jgi:hypothetical protein
MHQDHRNQALRAPVEQLCASLQDQGY